MVLALKKQNISANYVRPGARELVNQVLPLVSYQSWRGLLF